jgi:hypothetical protein
MLTIGTLLRRRIVIFLVASLLVLPVGAGIAHFVLGWWQPAHEAIVETAIRCDSASEVSSTLPEAMAVARQALERIERTVRDYSAVIVKRQRIGSQLITSVLFGKIREKPFSVYLNFLDRSDANVKGREVIYVEGRNKNYLLVHTPGLQDATVGTLSLDPKGLISMHNELHPIIDIGLANLCRQLLQRGEEAGNPNQVQVKRISSAQVNSRKCGLVEIVYAVQEPKVSGYLARVFIDDEWQVPTRVEVYQLPKENVHDPRLIEEYTYLDLKFNNGYSDADFDPKNRQYKFP